MEDTARPTAESVGILDFSDDKDSVLRLIGASEYSLRRGGSGIVDLQKSTGFATCRLKFSGELGDIAHKSIKLSDQGSQEPETAPSTKKMAAWIEAGEDHKSLRDMDYLFELGATGFTKRRDGIVSDATGRVSCVLPALGDSVTPIVHTIDARVDLLRTLTFLQLSQDEDYNTIDAPPPISESIEADYARHLLEYDGLVIHFDQTDGELLNHQERAIDILVQMFTQAVDTYTYNSTVPRLRRVVLAIGGVGVNHLESGSATSLLSLAAEDLYAISVARFAKRFPRVLEILKHLCEAIDKLHDEEHAFRLLGVPYDIFGDLAEFECLNRDPMDSRRELLGVTDVSIVFPPDITSSTKIRAASSFWRPFNAGDVFISALSNHAFSDTVFIVE